MIGAKNNMTTLAWWEQMPKDWYVQYLPKEEVIEKTIVPTLTKDEFKAQLLKDIPYFHKLYAKYHDPKALETARNLGIYLKKL